jgi:adenylate cyclase class 2
MWVMKDQELEVKFYINNLGAIEERLQSLGARLEQSRTHELNLRFDTPTGDLARSFRVLRLRQDTAARLTFKGPAHEEGGVRVRQELEFVVSDFAMARALLQALGYQVAMIYEKYRTTYNLEGMHIALDEMPYGNFTEIEGPDPATIQSASQRLGLDWSATVPASYAMLFSMLQAKLGLPFHDLIFDNFKDRIITAEQLEVKPADGAMPGQ